MKSKEQREWEYRNHYEARSYKVRSGLYGFVAWTLVGLTAYVFWHAMTQ
jgi:hypothetical protein